MRGYLVALAACLLCATTASAAAEEDARVALAMAAAARKPVAPVPGPAPAVKNCYCSPACCCGCNEGGECNCVTHTVPAQAAQAAPMQAFQPPVQQMQMQPAFRQMQVQPQAFMGASRGMQGAACGPRG